MRMLPGAQSSAIPSPSSLPLDFPASKLTSTFSGAHAIYTVSSLFHPPTLEAPNTESVGSVNSSPIPLACPRPRLTIWTLRLLDLRLTLMRSTLTLTSEAVNRFDVHTKTVDAGVQRLRNVLAQIQQSRVGEEQPRAVPVVRTHTIHIYYPILI
jgi:hypothetical protein